MDGVIDWLFNRIVIRLVAWFVYLLNDYSVDYKPSGFGSSRRLIEAKVKNRTAHALVYCPRMEKRPKAMAVLFSRRSWAKKRISSDATTKAKSSDMRRLSAMASRISAKSRSKVATSSLVFSVWAEIPNAEKKQEDQPKKKKTKRFTVGSYRLIYWASSIQHDW